MTSTRSRWFLAGALAVAALGTTLGFAPGLMTAEAAPSVSTTSSVSDPVGDALHQAPAFQDVVRGRITKTAGGDFKLLMEVAVSVPADPDMPQPAQSEIWWMWFLDDATTSPKGYPASPGFDGGREFVVYVSWDGSGFAGRAIDRRPLLTGGEAIVTPVEFSIDGAIVEAVLPSSLVGDFPASFGWGPRTIDWAAHVGSAGFHSIDDAEAIFNP